MLKNKTLLCTSYSTCPVYVNKHLSCLTYGRLPTKGRNNVGARNLRITSGFKKAVFKAEDYILNVLSAPKFPETRI